MNLRDATKIINKADTGIMLNRSEQKLAELMLQGNSLADINQQDSSTSNLRLNLDENADLGKFDNKECIKVKHDANLHHMLVVRFYIYYRTSFNNFENNFGRGFFGRFAT